MAGPLATVPVLELAVEGVSGVRLAASVGAARVELCAALSETEGITPSIGTMAQACEVGLPVHVLVRPRSGDFTYSAAEFDVLERDVVAVIRAGAVGIVVGVIAADGGPDVSATSRLAAAAREQDPAAEVTFHRAFDTVLASGFDAAEALRRLAESGVDRVLTSGGATDCAAGLATLGELVALGREHAPSVQVMAGGGVTPEIVPALVRAGVHAVHTSARPRGLGAARTDQPDLAFARSIATALTLGGPVS